MIKYFKGRYVSWKQALAVVPFFKGSDFLIPVAAIHSINDLFSIIKEKLQPRILPNLLCFCKKRIVARRYHKY